MIFSTLAALLALSSPPRTLRVDYFHTGRAGEERFALDAVVLEPLPWPGNPRRPIDETNSGAYLFEVRDQATQRLLYSRGFASLFGEWQSTGEAKAQDRTFHESLRFAAPERPVQIVLKRRSDKTQLFTEVWTFAVDPAAREVDTAPPPPAGPLIALQKSGEPQDKLDFLIIGDGYTAAERGKFEKDARRLVDILFSYAPFKARRTDFNVWGLCPPARESGISRPSTGVHRRSPLGATYDAFGAERYVLTFDNKTFRDAAAQAPYELVEILVNGKTYGGGGIFNLYGTVAADSLWAPYVFVHELGHHMAGLADEYFTSPSVYESHAARPEPWEPNVTARPTRPKWATTPGTPLPTPWSAKEWLAWQEEVQEKRRAVRAQNRPEAEMDALFSEEKRLATQRLRGEKYATQVGAFEGANYEAKGYYRPQADCVMFTRDEVPFCAVCQQALGRIIDLYTK